MKLPHGLVYAVLIVVAILAVSLYGRHGGSSVAAGAVSKAQARDPLPDDAPADAKIEDDSRAPSDAKNTDDAQK